MLERVKGEKKIISTASTLNAFSTVEEASDGGDVEELLQSPIPIYFKLAFRFIKFITYMVKRVLWDLTPFSL